MRSFQRVMKTKALKKWRLQVYQSSFIGRNSGPLMYSSLHIVQAL
jgi:hypothetical protein